jgi:hypothetical protein
LTDLNGKYAACIVSCLSIPSLLVPLPDYRPGTYKADPTWIKRDHHFTAPPPKQRVNFNRTASAPSIPARDQSYG